MILFCYQIYIKYFLCANQVWHSICNIDIVNAYDDISRGVITSHNGVTFSFGWLVSKKASQFEMLF